MSRRRRARGDTASRLGATSVAFRQDHRGHHQNDPTWLERCFRDHQSVREAACDSCRVVTKLIDGLPVNFKRSAHEPTTLHPEHELLRADIPHRRQPGARLGAQDTPPAAYPGVPYDRIPGRDGPYQGPACPRRRRLLRPSPVPARVSRLGANFGRIPAGAVVRVGPGVWSAPHGLTEPARPTTSILSPSA
jgi:hypothetical protein